MRLLILCGLLLLGLDMRTAHAADPQFCSKYAESAVEQARIALSDPRCEHEARGPRWSTHYREHYDWCLGARFQEAEQERDARHRHLEYCRR